MSRGHNVENPRGRWPVALACALWLSAPACAHGTKPASSGAPAPADLAERVAQLSQRVEERERLVTQLESRLSLLEAEQRQLRYALAERETAPAGLHETVRIGADATSQEERPTQRKSEPRPVLRLYENRRSTVPLDEAGLEPVPQVSERLPVAPLPESLGLERTREPSGQPDRAGVGDPYLTAIDLVRRRDFSAALGALSAFVREHPGDERVGRAQFWRGEVLFAQRQYSDALAAFESSLSREPRGEKAPDSLLKIGLCHKRLGALERARAAMRQLKTQFPQSHAARLAQAEEA